MNIKTFFKMQDSYRTTLFALMFSLLVTVLSYYRIAVFEFTNSDGICEGWAIYRNGDWASRCGRWGIRWMALMTGNIVIPAYVVLMYGLCLFLTIVLLAKLWDICNLYCIIGLCCIMVAEPSIIAQMTYTHTTLAYAFSCLCSVLFFFSVAADKGSRVIRCGAGMVFLAIAMGMYQSYIGVAAAGSAITVLLLLADGKPMKKVWEKAGELVFSGFFGCVLYLVIMNLDLRLRNLEPADRTDAVSFKAIISDAPESFLTAYRSFFEYFSNSIYHRNILYTAAILLLVVLSVFEAVTLARSYNFGRAGLFILIILLLPAFMNIIRFITPFSPIKPVMRYQMVLIFPLMCALTERLVRQTNTVHYATAFRNTLIVLSVLLGWTFVVSANATYRGYQIAYRKVNLQTELMLQDVYALEGYKPDKTPILIAGFPSVSHLRETEDIFKYNEYMPPNPVLWMDMHGAINARYYYLLDYFGIDGKRFSRQDYYNVIDSDEFKQMKVWPEEGSVRIIQGKAVVKLSENPAR